MNPTRPKSKRSEHLVSGAVLLALVGITVPEAFPVIAQKSAQTTSQPPAQTSAQLSVPQPSAPARFAFGGNAAEIPAEFLNSLIFLPVDVNKTQPSLFELDSTSAASSISPARATELGLTNLQDPVLNLPGVDMPFTNFTTIDKPNFSAETGQPYLGTLGADFLSRVVVEIDYARQTVRLYDPGVYKYSGKGTAFPLRFDGNMPVIRAKFTLPGQRTHEGDFVVNTALDAALIISERFAETHRIFSSHVKNVGSSDPEIEDGANIVLGRLAEFQIGRFDIRSPIAAFVRQGPNSSPDSNRAGMIGGGMLRRFTVIFDYAHQQLILDPNTHFADYEQEDKSGISVVAKGPGLKTFEVASVQPGSPGEEAGIVKGDVIAGVDEEAAADLTLVSIRALFRQVGHKYKLLIQRNGQAIPITVTMRRLI
jgi:hypothetical protein